MKKEDTISINLPGETLQGERRKCNMSIDLYQNACLTMGELRDLMRATGISWEFIQHEIDRANSRRTGIEKVMDSMDPYMTGPGRSLKDLPRNVW